MTKIGIDDFESIPVKNRCQYLLYKKVIESEHPMTTYELMKYGRTLDMCSPFGMTYNSIRRLIESWEGHGLIELVSEFQLPGARRIIKKRRGVDMLEWLRIAFDDVA